jgi:hypothetical protein
VVEGWQAIALTAAAAGVEIGIEPLNRFETHSQYPADARSSAMPLAILGRRLIDTFPPMKKTIGEALRAAKHLNTGTCENDCGVPAQVTSRGEFFSTVAEIALTGGYDRGFWFRSASCRLPRQSGAIRPTPDAIAFDGVTPSAPM